MEIDNLGLLAQVMNKLLQPGVRISDHHVTNLVKYFTGMKGKCKVSIRKFK